MSDARDRRKSTVPGTANHEGAGHAQKLGELWRKHGREVLDRCRSLMKDSEDAKEAFSRTIFRATTNLQRQADEIADPRAWLLAIAYRVCMDLYRERSRHPDGRLEEVTPRSREWEPAHGGDPERAILDKELEAVLCEAIETLPARLGGALRAYLSTGSYRGIAEQFGITEVNARKRIQEARGILRRRLDAYRSGRPAQDKARRAGAHTGRGCLLDDSTPRT